METLTLTPTVQIPFQIKRDTNYRGFTIHPVFNFTNGRSDFEVFEEGDEEGMMFHVCTLSYVKEIINDIREERPQDFRVTTKINPAWRMYNITKFDSFIAAVKFAARHNGELSINVNA